MRSFFKIFFLSVLCCSVGYSQFEKSELAPPGIKWYEKRSKNFIVYFPKELDSIANYTISFLENNYAFKNFSLISLLCSVNSLYEFF